jgi:hypothetical protein
VAGSGCEQGEVANAVSHFGFAPQAGFGAFVPGACPCGMLTRPFGPAERRQGRDGVFFHARGRGRRTCRSPTLRTAVPDWRGKNLRVIERRSSHSRFEQGTVTGARRVAAARRAHFYAHPQARTFEGGIGLSRGAGPHFAARGTRPLYSL